MDDLTISAGVFVILLLIGHIDLVVGAVVRAVRRMKERGTLDG